MKRLSEFAPFMVDNVMTLTQVEGKELFIVGYKLVTTRFGEAVVMKVKDGDTEYGVITSSRYVRDALEHVDTFPVTATFKRSGRYWVIE
jgi:hypothetical protein